MIYQFKSGETVNIVGPGAPIYVLGNAGATGGVTPPVSGASDYIPVWRPRRR